MADRGTGRTRLDADPVGLVVTGLLIALAALVWWDRSALSLESTYGIGPAAMPTLVAAGLALLAVANGVNAFREGRQSRERMDGRAVALILGGLLALIASIAGGLGFVPGVAILFAATARAFGRRAILVDLAIGIVLAILIYLLFARLLTLTLPVGPIERLF